MPTLVSKDKQANRPLTRRVTAVLLVQTPKVFHFLGHKPVLNWALDQFDHVRGVDHVMCVAQPRLVEQTRKLLALEEVDVTAIPKALAQRSAAEFDRWLCTEPAAGASTVLVVNPASPFLPAAKIEACLATVHDGFADVAATTVHLRSEVTPAANYRELNETLFRAEVPGCRAFRSETLAQRQSRFRPVPVSLVESLNVEEREHLHVASALVAAGAI